LFFRPCFCRKTSFLTKIAEDDLSLCYRALENHSSVWCLPKTSFSWLHTSFQLTYHLKYPNWASYRFCPVSSYVLRKHCDNVFSRVFKCNWQLSFGIDERAIKHLTLPSNWWQLSSRAISLVKYRKMCLELIVPKTYTSTWQPI
jgi:hypothetical protein